MRSFLLACVLLLVGQAAAALTDEAESAYLRGDYEQAMKLALPEAEAGDAAALHMVGVMYWRGQGVKREDAEALKWFERAAKLNDVHALTDLANLHYLGEGTAKDYKKAFDLFTRAAKLGGESAQLSLGRLYESGKGTTKDLLLARYWMERADALQADRTLMSRPLGAGAIGKLPEGCTPKTPPTHAMAARGLNAVSGTLQFRVDTEGRIRGVVVKQISVEAIEPAAVAWFSMALRSERCVLPTSVRGGRVEVPFFFNLI